MPFYMHNGVRREYKTKTMFAITHVGKHGFRTLTFANQGRNHYATRKDAETALAAFAGDLRRKVLGDAADTLRVRPIECYEHGDALGIYFDEAEADES